MIILLNERMKYSIRIYFHCSAQNANKLQVMQNKLLKLLSRKHGITPNDEIHNCLNILKVHDIINVVGLHVLIIEMLEGVPIQCNIIIQKDNVCSVRDQN